MGEGTEAVAALGSMAKLEGESADVGASRGRGDDVVTSWGRA